ncbi:MAG: YesL family protein [Acholeplasmataceae bacterium]
MLKEFYKNMTDIIFANFIWILVSFLGILITLGASTTALFRVVFQVFKTKEPTSVVQTFFKSFKENFWFSTLVYFGLLIIGASLYLMLNYAFTYDQPWLLVIGVVVGYQWLIFTIYFFPVLAVFKTKTKLDLIKNVLLLSNYHIWTNIKLIGSIVAVFFLIFYVHEVFILVAIALYAFMVSYFLKPIFDRYIWKLDEEGSN